MIGFIGVERQRGKPYPSSPDVRGGTYCKIRPSSLFGAGRGGPAAGQGQPWREAGGDRRKAGRLCIPANSIKLVDANYTR